MGSPSGFDFSQAIPLPQSDAARGLQGAVFSSTDKNPDEYAKLLEFQKLTGVPPEISQGNPAVKQHADVNAINYQKFSTDNPRTTAWASKPENAAVSGVPEIHRMAGIEQNAVAMRAATAYATGGLSDAIPNLLGEAWGWANTPFNLGHLRENIASSEARVNAGPTLADVQAYETHPILSSIKQALETGITGFSTNAAKMLLTPLSAALAIGGPAAQVAGKAMPAIVPVARGLETAIGLGFGAKGAHDQFNEGLTRQPGESWADYMTRTSSNAAMVLGGVTAGAHASPNPLDAISRAASEGLGEGAREAVGQSAKPLPQTPVPPGLESYFTRDSYLGNLAEMVGSAETSKLRERSPDKFYEVQQAIHAGDPSLRIPAQEFSSHFKGDANNVAESLGVKNFGEAILAGSDVEVPTADFLAKMHPDDQKALLGHIVSPTLGDMTATQYEDARAEAEQFVSSGGIEKLIADAQKADAETAASPDYQQLHEQFRQQHIDSGETPEVADTLATTQANVYSNLARQVNMKPAEVAALYNPKFVTGEAPSTADTLSQMASDKGVGDKSTQPFVKTPAGAVPELRSLDDVIGILTANKDRKLYVRSSSGPSYDLKQKQSMDYQSRTLHKGLSAVRIEPEWLDDEYMTPAFKRAYILKRLTEYNNRPSIGGKEQRLWIYEGEKVGEDSDGYESIANILPVAVLSKELANSRDRVILEAQIADSKEAAQKLKDPAALSIAQNSLSQLQQKWERDYGKSENTPSPTNGGEVLHQSAEDGARGWYRELPDGTFEIGTTSRADLSTKPHELGHLYLRMIADLAKREGASDVLKDDYQKIMDFIGAKDGEPFSREHQERFAQATEQYLREGKAPSPGLKGAFQRFAIWLVAVYKHATPLGIPLPDEIRDVFDRLYAAEEGVNKAEAESGPRLFTSPEEAGWTEEQFKEYAEQNSVSVEQAKSHILWMLNEAALREKTQMWRDEENNVREAVTAQIDQSPEYTAIRSLRRGTLDDGTPMTLSREELVKQFGEDRVKELQKQHPSLYRIEGGIDTETAAEMLGFNSAEEMMKALEASPRRKAAIEGSTRDYMTAKHGDIRYDGSLQDKAELALANDQRAENLHRELDALNRRNNPEFELREAQRELQRHAREQAEDAKQQRRVESRDQRIEALKQKVAELRDAIRTAKQERREGNRTAQDVAPIAAYREVAHQTIESKAVADLQPTRYLDASRKYSREAIAALARGDYEEAKQAKHKELMNHFLFREATKAKEYIGKFESYVTRVQKKPAQQSLGKAGSDYRDQFNRLLGRYNLGPEVNTERTLAEWTMEQYANGKDPGIDPAILNEARSIVYRNTPISEIRQLHDALVNVRKLAMLELEMTVNGRKVVFETAKKALIEAARVNVKVRPEPIFEEDKPAGTVVHDYVSRGAAPLARMEFIVNRLDGGKTGPWHDFLFNLSADAQGVESKLQEEVTGRLGDAMKNMPKEIRDRLMEKVTVPSIDIPITRKRMLDMMFNMGNEGNLDRLQRTFIANGWDMIGIHHVANLATQQEWQFVKDTVEALKPLGQAQFELERRQTGLPPVMVIPKPLDIMLHDGSQMHWDGGYFPIVMDPLRSKRGAQSGMSALEMVDSGYTRVATSRGNMQERTGYGGPLLLDHEQILTNHVAKVAKDISHREFVLAANKFLTDPEIRQTLRETLGPGYEKQMMPWLRTTVNDVNGSATQGLRDLSGALQLLRTNLVVASLAAKVSTIGLQLTHASSVLLHTSASSYAQAFIDFMAHPAEMTQQIRDLSPNEMAHRGEHIDRDAAKLYKEKISGPSTYDRIGKAGMFPIRMMDHMLSFSLWLAVQRDVLAANAKLPEGERLSDSEANYSAMHQADGAVRMGLGANAPKDLPAVMRKNDFWKLVTTLGGFANLKLNQAMLVAADTGRAARAGNYGKVAGTLTYGTAMVVIVPAVLGAYITGQRPKDDENAGEWAAKRALLFLPETVPLLGNVVNAMETGRDPRFSPLEALATNAAKTARDLNKEEPDWTGIGIESGEEAGDLFGVPGTGQAAKTARYYHHAELGYIEDPNFWDAIMGAPKK